ncbi:hypothetical protein SAMN02745136_04939 [Anaerocolumna jejuensis DSM 15929]|uniref:Uncharacterized protein n=1 Tax=Anaerocolumna jejuensis DSM 15929 TaxID=1121322 RepID=A0A1M7ARM3_9FIRM|nr:hypothetical protein [Anaerocolumna jejuensis]SHL45351.1 hypothetical protein SAMN02745136_04939 [Anaerocolumna jejuensis DSM 15929]
MNNIKLNNCVNNIYQHISQLGESYRTSAEFRKEKLRELVKKNEYAKELIIYYKSDEELNDANLIKLKECLKNGIDKHGYLLTDFELEYILSLKDSDKKTNMFYKQVQEIRSSIEKAYLTILLMIGYDSVEASKMSLRKIRVLTISGVMSEFLSELVELSELVSNHESEIYFEVEDSGEIKKVYLDDINGIIHVMIESWQENR